METVDLRVDLRVDSSVILRVDLRLDLGNRLTLHTIFYLRTYVPTCSIGEADDARDSRNLRSK